MNDREDEGRTMTEAQRKHAGEQRHPHGQAKAAPEARAEAVEAQPPAADAASLEAELARLSAERDTYLDHLKRLQAEFENYRRRVQREAEQLRKLAAEDVVASLLPVIDNMYRACQAAERHDEGQVVEGVEKVTGQLVGLLGSQGLEELPTEPGDPFDPMLHEAVLAQPSDEFEEGAIIAVLDRGYRLHDKLLRPARVIVSNGA
jgi:molecular chaperone GrpE